MSYITRFLKNLTLIPITVEDKKVNNGNISKKTGNLVKSNNFLNLISFYLF